jgi:hypothetical protein
MLDKKPVTDLSGPDPGPAQGGIGGFPHTKELAGLWDPCDYIGISMGKSGHRPTGLASAGLCG